MSTTFLSAQFKPGGVLTNATTAVLSDATGTYGIKRNDTDAVVVADGTALVNSSTGVYTYSFADPASDLTYTYALEFVYGGITYRSTGQLTGGATATEPITLAEAKAHCRIDLDNTDSDTVLAIYIASARLTAEKFLGRALLNRTVVTQFDGFADCMELPWPPLHSVTSITYLDEDGASQTLASTVYRVRTDTFVGRVELDYNQSWPATYPVSGAVTITHVSGYGSSTTDVPEIIRLAMLHMVARWFEQREPMAFAQTSTLDNMELSLLHLADRVVPV